MLNKFYIQSSILLKMDANNILKYIFDKGSWKLPLGLHFRVYLTLCRTNTPYEFELFLSKNPEYRAFFIENDVKDCLKKLRCKLIDIFYNIYGFHEEAPLGLDIISTPLKTFVQSVEYIPTLDEYPLHPYFHNTMNELMVKIKAIDVVRILFMRFIRIYRLSNRTSLSFEQAVFRKYYSKQHKTYAQFLMNLFKLEMYIMYHDDNESSKRFFEYFHFATVIRRWFIDEYISVLLCLSYPCRSSILTRPCAYVILDYLCVNKKILLHVRNCLDILLFNRQRLLVVPNVSSISSVKAKRLKK